MGKEYEKYLSLRKEARRLENEGSDASAAWALADAQGLLANKEKNEEDDAKVVEELKKGHPGRYHGYDDIPAHERPDRYEDR